VLTCSAIAFRPGSGHANMPHVMPTLQTVLFLAAMVLGASSSAASPSKCVPGRSVACACEDGAKGAKVCNARGRFEPCSCKPKVATVKEKVFDDDWLPKQPPKATAPAAGTLPTLTERDIVTAMRDVQVKVQACANQAQAIGTAMTSMQIAAGGAVSSAVVTGRFAGTTVAACIEAAAKTAKFPRCSESTFPWPFTLSPR
jgi:hypothetical protein